MTLFNQYHQDGFLGAHPTKLAKTVFRTWGLQADQGRGTVWFRTDSGRVSWHQSLSYNKWRVGHLYAFLENYPGQGMSWYWWERRLSSSSALALVNGSHNLPLLPFSPWLLYTFCQTRSSYCSSYSKTVTFYFISVLGWPRNVCTETFKHSAGLKAPAINFLHALLARFGMARLEEVGRDYFLTIYDFLEVISSVGRMLDWSIQSPALHPRA